MSNRTSKNSAKDPYMRPEKMVHNRFWNDTEPRMPSQDFPLWTSSMTFKVDEYENRWGLEMQRKLSNGRDILK